MEERGDGRARVKPRSRYNGDDEALVTCLLAHASQASFVKYHDQPSRKNRTLDASPLDKKQILRYTGLVRDLRRFGPLKTSQLRRVLEQVQERAVWSVTEEKREAWTTTMAHRLQNLMRDASQSIVKNVAWAAPLRCEADIESATTFSYNLELNAPMRHGATDDVGEFFQKQDSSDTDFIWPDGQVHEITDITVKEFQDRSRLLKPHGGPNPRTHHWEKIHHAHNSKVWIAFRADRGMLVSLFEMLPEQTKATQICQIAVKNCPTELDAIAAMVEVGEEYITDRVALSDIYKARDRVMATREYLPTLKGKPTIKRPAAYESDAATKPVGAKTCKQPAGEAAPTNEVRAAVSKRVSKKSPSAEVSESATLSTTKHSPEPSLDGLTYDENGSTEDKDQTPSYKQSLAERLGWDTTGPPESAYEDAMRSAICSR